MKEKILFHNVEYWYREQPNKTLIDLDREHIVYMINEGYSSGELSDGAGWWQIEGYETN